MKIIEKQDIRTKREMLIENTECQLSKAILEPITMAHLILRDGSYR